MSHTCKSLLMHCMDFRFGKAMKGFMEEHSMMDDADLVSIAGAAKNIVNPETREFALRQIEISKTLHEMKEVVFVAHTDCGAYGGRKSFETDEVEYNKLTGDMKEAREIVKAKWPELSVKLWLARIEETEHEKKITFEEIA
ncbi:MAG: carbonic anhydrase [Patescibacteria group bacterium]